jgi:shikimate kinase
VVKSISENAPTSGNNQKKLNRRKQGSKSSIAHRRRNSSFPADAKHASLPQVLLLIGFMGAGKSSVGAALAAQLGWAFEDLDRRIEKRHGRKISEIFRESGESGFRKLESEALQELLQELQNEGGKVIALGGGAFAQESNAKSIETAGIRTVFLDAGIGELWQRCKDQSAQEGMERPLLLSRKNFQLLYEQRRPHYLKASLRHETSGKTVEHIAAELIKALKLNPKRQGRGENQ